VIDPGALRDPGNRQDQPADYSASG